MVSNSAELRSSHSYPWINYKLSFIRLFCWRNRDYTFLRGRIEWSLVLFFELEYVFSKIFVLLRGHRSCLSVPSWDLSSNFTAQGLRWCRGLTCIFPSDGPFFSRILAWRSVDCMNRTRRIDSKTFSHRVSSKLCAFRRFCWLWVLRETTQLRCSFSQWPLHVLISLFRHFIWLLVNFIVREHTLISCFATRFSLKALTFGRMPTLTKRSCASTFQIVSARLSKNSVSLTSASDASLSRRASTSCHWWLGRWSGFRCRFWCTIITLMLETALVSPSNTGLSRSTGNTNLFLFQRHLSTFDSWPLDLIKISSVWRQSFVI